MKRKCLHRMRLKLQTRRYTRRRQCRWSRRRARHVDRSNHARWASSSSPANCGSAGSLELVDLEEAWHTWDRDDEVWDDDCISKRSPTIILTTRRYFLFTYITTTTVPSFAELQTILGIDYFTVSLTVAIPALGLAIGPLFWSSCPTSTADA